MATKPSKAPQFPYIVVPLLEDGMTPDWESPTHYQDKGPAADHAKKLAEEGKTVMLYEAAIIFEAVREVRQTWTRNG